MRCRLALVLLALLTTSPAAMAGILIEGTLEGQPVRIELGEQRDRTIMTVGDTRRLVDLTTGEIKTLAGPEQAPPRPPFNGTALDGFRLQPWYSGPMVAGHRSTYNVLTRDRLICAEVAASEWMARFLAPAVSTIEVLQRVDGRIAPKGRGECGAMPFRLYASQGWPLMAGYKTERIFVTDRLQFDYPSPIELKRPALPDRD